MIERIHEQDRIRVIVLEACYDVSTGPTIVSFGKTDIVAGVLRAHRITETAANHAFDWLLANNYIKGYTFSSYVITDEGIRAVEDRRNTNR